MKLFLIALSVCVLPACVEARRDTPNKPISCANLPPFDVEFPKSKVVLKSYFNDANVYFAICSEKVYSVDLRRSNLKSKENEKLQVMMSQSTVVTHAPISMVVTGHLEKGAGPLHSDTMVIHHIFAFK
jgi:hypothetical protein